MSLTVYAIKKGVRYTPTIVASGENRGKYQMHPRYVPQRHKLVNAHYIETLNEVVEKLRSGDWCLRMTPDTGQPPSLIIPDEITIDDDSTGEINLESIESKHVIEAIKQIDAGVEHPYDDSKKYYLDYMGRHYPPKAVVGVAHKIANGHFPERLYGGEGSWKANDVLKRLGFTVIEKTDATTPGEFTHYWAESNNDEKVGMPMQHIASNEFTKRGVRPGSSVFCFNYHGGKLYLIGRMIVEKIVDAEEAAEYIGVDEVGFRECKEHCVCNPGLGSPITFQREVPIELASQLRFISSTGRDKVLIEDGIVDSQTMRAIRQLTQDSADLLHEFIESDIDPDTVEIDDDYSAEEWHSKLVIHIGLEQQRDNHIVALKKAQAKHLRCEVCNFDFEAVYGEWGRGFIECHHRKPFSEIQEGEVTTLESLALVCANCHRMLHKSTVVLSVERLRGIVEMRRKMNNAKQN